MQDTVLQYFLTVWLGFVLVLAVHVLLPCTEFRLETANRILWESTRLLFAVHVHLFNKLLNSRMF